MKRSKIAKLGVSALAVSLCGSVLFFTSAEAEAKWTRSTAVGCRTDGGIVNFSAATGIRNNSVTSTLNVLCDAPDRDDYPKTNIDDVNIHVRDGSTAGSVTARACATNPWFEGAVCSFSVSTPHSDAGNYTLSPSLNSWASVGDFGYLSVTLPIRQGTSQSAIRGIWTTD